MLKDLLKYGPIKSSIGNNMQNEKEDVVAVKESLRKLGYLQFDLQKAEPHGYITRDLDTGIKKFQSDNNLKIDGILEPQGETEYMIGHNLYQTVRDKVEAEPLAPPPGKKIPGTNIPDKGIPEQGYPNSRRYNPHKQPHPVNPDPLLEKKPPSSGLGMPVIDPDSLLLPFDRYI
ncbi:MAG: peptidoglycan-binding protein [Rhodospirillales bacterium]|nr:peptidoglycan-binding protein [Rhodospirillales bacterium]